MLLGVGGWVIDSELARFDSSIDMARSRCLPARFLLRAGARDTPADSLTYPLTFSLALPDIPLIFGSSRVAPKLNQTRHDSGRGDLVFGRGFVLLRC